MEATRIPSWTLGERLAKARADAGLTQDDMAERFGLSHSTIAKWEKNKGQPRGFMLVIRRWSQITGVPESWLLGLDEEFDTRGSRARRRNGPGRDRPGGRRSETFSFEAAS